MQDSDAFDRAGSCCTLAYLTGSEHDHGASLLAGAVVLEGWCFHASFPQGRRSIALCRRSVQPRKPGASILAATDRLRHELRLRGGIGAQRCKRTESRGLRHCTTRAKFREVSKVFQASMKSSSIRLVLPTYSAVARQASTLLFVAKVHTEGWRSRHRRYGCARPLHLDYVYISRRSLCLAEVHRAPMNTVPVIFESCQRSKMIHTVLVDLCLVLKLPDQRPYFARLKALSFSSHSGHLRRKHVAMRPLVQDLVLQTSRLTPDARPGDGGAALPNACSACFAQAVLVRANV